MPRASLASTFDTDEKAERATAVAAIRLNITEDDVGEGDRNARSVRGPTFNGVLSSGNNSIQSTSLGRSSNEYGKLSSLLVQYQFEDSVVVSLRFAQSHTSETGIYRGKSDGLSGSINCFKHPWQVDIFTRGPGNSDL